MADAPAPRGGVAYGVTLGSTFAGDARAGDAYAAFKSTGARPRSPRPPSCARGRGRGRGRGDGGFQSVVEGGGDLPRHVRRRERDVPSSSAQDVGVGTRWWSASHGEFTVEKIGGGEVTVVSRGAETTRAWAWA